MTIINIIEKAFGAGMSITLTHSHNRKKGREDFPYVLSKGDKVWYCRDFKHVVDTINNHNSNRTVVWG